MVKSIKTDEILPIWELENEIFKTEAWSLKQLKQHLEFNNRIFVKHSTNGDVEGYMVITEVLGEWEILRVATSPKERRRGVARELLNYLFRTINPKDTIFLEVRSDNLAALSLYESIRFCRVATRKGYYQDGVDAICMRRDVT